MKTLEVNDEKFIVIYECKEDRLIGTKLKSYHKLHNSDTVIRGGGMLYFVKCCETVKFYDILENGKAFVLYISGSAVNGDYADTKKLKVDDG